MLGNSYQKGPVIWAHIFGMLVWIKTHFIRSRGSVSKWNLLCVAGRVRQSGWNCNNAKEDYASRCSRSNNFQSNLAHTMNGKQRYRVKALRPGSLPNRSFSFIEKILRGSWIPINRDNYKDDDYDPI